MNLSAFSGPLSGQPFFQWLHPNEQKHAHLKFYVRVRGIGKDPDQYPQVVVYGQKALKLYEVLHPGMWVQVVGRYRKRKDNRGRVQHEFVANHVEYTTLRYLLGKAQAERFLAYLAHQQDFAEYLSRLAEAER